MRRTGVGVAEVKGTFSARMQNALFIVVNDVDVDPLQLLSKIPAEHCGHVVLLRPHAVRAVALQ